MTQRWKLPVLPSKARGLALVALLATVAALVGQGCPPQSTPDPNSGLTGDYVGSERCFTCHSRTHDEWMQTRHRQAYDELVALGQENNSVCLTCHTTAYGLPGGFQSASTTELLATVGCEACHGPARAHVMDVSNKNLRPPVKVDAEWCSACHNGFHHDTYSEWSNSAHGRPTESVAEELHEGLVANNCGNCHSGDVLLAKNFNPKNTVSDAILAGKPVEDINGTTCSVCHDPHSNTGNAVMPPPGHDFQLRRPEVASPEPTNVIALTTDPDRFNLCGSCHHERGRTWTTNSRGPHHSIQANFYVGEMPADEGQAPLVPNQRSAHRFVQKQCVTCHMQHEAHVGDPSALDAAVTGSTETPSHVGHHFTVESMSGCIASGCHPNEAVVQTDLARMRAEIQGRLDAIAARMGPTSTWMWSAEGGPPANQQNAIPEAVRKARFLWAWVSFDGSLGVHNPGYARAVLTEAENLLTSIGR